jgi:peptidoglycan hydrolase-like protein with peptidoglycan-binding domain
MRVWILAVSVLGILACADLANAGPSMTTRDESVTAAPDPAASTEEATQATEDRIGLDKRKRSDVQRRLTRLGFDVKASGKFDEKTRAVILRWQAARDYPATGFLNAPQHQALVTESASTAQASISERQPAVSERPARRRNARHHRGGGGPIAAIGGVVGGVVGGVFGRR